MTESLPLRKMSTPSAQKLEAYVSLYQDLKYVMRLTYEALKLLEAEKPDTFLLQNYWSAALIAYRRAFNTGVRGQRAPVEEFVNYDGAPETHRYFLRQADKLIAHSVNPFEKVSVGVFVDGKGVLKGVGELASQLIATSSEGFQELNQLAKIVLLRVEEIINESRTVLLEEASKLTPEDLLKLPAVKYIAPDAIASEKSRRD